MFNRTFFLVSFLACSCVAIALPSISHAQVQVAQIRTSAQVKQLLDDGRRLVDRGDYAGAISVYQQAAELEPRNASIHSGIGYLYAQQGNYSASLSSYRRAVSLNPNNPDYQYALGFVSGSMGDYRTAKEAYRNAIRLNRNNVNSYVGLATVLLRLGEYSNAKWAYGEAVKIDANNPQVRELKTMLNTKSEKR